MNRSTRAVDAIIDALVDPAVPNGGTMRSPVRHLPEPTSPIRPAVIARPAVHDWICEQCYVTGQDWADMQAHVQDTGHRHFTDIDRI